MTPPVAAPRARDPGRRRVENCLVAAGAVAAVVALWPLLCTAPGIPWNAARLAPSFALARGLPIYALRESGAHLGWFYGPVFPLWYLPMGATDNPTAGLFAAAVWNAATLLLPVYLVARVAAGEARGDRRFLFVLGALLLLANEATRSAFLFVHVDALSVACAVAACLALQAGVRKAWRPGLPLAAGAVALAVAAKQVSIVLVPATICWLACAGGRRFIARWIFWIVVIGGAGAALAFTVFGAEEMLFNAWLLFSRIPLRGGWALAGQNLLAVLADGWLWLLAGGVGASLLRARWKQACSPEARALMALFIWLAAWQLPLGIVASLMVNASLNSIHAPIYLLFAALVLAGSALTYEAQDDEGALRSFRAFAWVLAALALVPALWQIRNQELVWTPYRGQEELIALARRHQGRIYLPWNPLTTIITERKVYPFDDALYCLWLARLEPPPAAITGAVPPDPLIIYQEPSQSHFALRYFDPKKIHRLPLGKSAAGE